MKRPRLIGLLLFAALLAACRPAPVERQGMASPRPELSDIDNMMWRHPDSAFVLLQGFASSPKADSLDAFNVHYFQLLLSELLYKNYCAQTNREELLKAVVYFDSLTMENGQGAGKRSTEAQDRNAFLDARAHYINGVGYYEADSVVESCGEYLKALETVETHFQKDDIQVFDSLLLPHFSFLTLTRLGELFSKQFMMEPAIECEMMALECLERHPHLPLNKSNTLYRIGILRDNSGEKESARSYYRKAIEALPDTSGLLYRDIFSSMALLEYQLNHEAKPAFQRLKRMVDQTDDRDEQLTRYATIGTIYFVEKQYESARYYLESVFEQKTDALLRMQSADYLYAIYDSAGRTEKAGDYLQFLARNKPMEYDTEAKVSQLNTLFQCYMGRKKETRAAEQITNERKIAIRRTSAVLIPIFLSFTLLIFMTMRKRHTKSLLAKEAETKKHLREKDMLLTEHETKAKAMERQLKRLKTANKTPKQQRTEADLRYEAFFCEPICSNIIASVRDLHITTRSRYADFHEIALTNAMGLSLSDAVAKHFPNLVSQLATLTPKLTWKDVQICHLCLLKLEDAQIAALLQCNHSTVYRRKARLQKALGITVPFAEFIRNQAYSQG